MPFDMQMGAIALKKQSRERTRATLAWSSLVNVRCDSTKRRRQARFRIFPYPPPSEEEGVNDLYMGEKNNRPRETMEISARAAVN